MTKKHILLVEDDLNFGSVMKSFLEMNDLYVDWVDDGQNAIDTFKKGFYDLCILDVMLPHVDGFTIGTQIKQTKPAMPIIYLTAKNMKEDIIKGFKIGADDYITKPFDSEVLIYKIKAILKRNPFSPAEAERNDTTVNIGRFVFNFRDRSLTFEDGTQSKLSPKEADLLFFLHQNVNNVLDRNYTLEKIWGETGYFTARSMDVFITRLRKLLKADENIEISNVHGSGYILKVKE
ncbi:MAG: response regulator transcription factor [Salinivirgaceae bacterium]|nr:response regulator transcription factor [Salinivirgaceae bacterium]